MKIIEKLKNKIINTDAKKLLKLLPDKSIDLILTDPCYGIDYTGQLLKKHGGLGLSITKHGWKDYDAQNYTWDKERTDPETIKEFLRVGKEQIIWGGNYFADILPKSQGWFVWNKAQRNFSLADGELAWTSFDKALRIYDYSRANYKADEPNRFHMTQKPLKLFKWCLLKAKLKPGAIVLDPFAGSCTTAEACIDMGYSYICAEIDPKMCIKARERITNRLNQKNLFNKEELEAINLSVFEQEREVQE